MSPAREQAAGALSPSGFAVSVDELFQGRGVRMALGAGGGDNPSTSSTPGDGLTLRPSALNLPLAALAEQAASANCAGSGQHALRGRAGSGGARAAPGQTPSGGNPYPGSGAFQPYAGQARPCAGAGKAAGTGNSCALLRGCDGGSGGSQPLDVAGLLQSIPSGGFGAAEAAARAPAIFLDPATLQALAAAALPNPSTDPASTGAAPRYPDAGATREPPAQEPSNTAGSGPGLAIADAQCGAEALAGPVEANGNVSGGRASVACGPGVRAMALPAGADSGLRDEGSGQRWPADMAVLLTNPALLAGNPALATLLVSAALSVGAPLHALALGISNSAGVSNPAPTLAAPPNVKVLPADGAPPATARGAVGGDPSQAPSGGPGSAPALGERQASPEDPQSPSPTAFKENKERLQTAADAAGALLAGGMAAAAHAGGCSGVAGSGLGLGQGAAGGEPPDALFSPSQYLLKECR